MFKKISISILFALMIFLGGCTQTTTTTEDLNAVLPDLTGMSQVEISDTLTSLDLTVKFYIDTTKIYESDDEYDKFVSYGSDLVAGNSVPKGTEVRVYTTPLTLELKYLYELGDYTDSEGNSIQLTTADYTNKEFIADGIGEVTVSKYVDGDTTMFDSNGFTFSVRYLGIDTPESTALYEPWGKAASKYTSERLSNAEKIVLQAEGDRQDGNGRYLAWVWYIPEGGDTFLLLNLELVELAYSKNKVAIGSKYTQILTLADWDASLTKRRVWGEIDPNFDYSKEGTQMSVEYLLANFNEYVGLKVVVTGVITRMIGQNIYIQDETGYGVYMYAGFTTSAQLQVGAHVSIGGLIPTYYSGSPQLSNFNKINLSLWDSEFVALPITITYNDFDFTRIGSLVTMENLTVTSISVAATSGSTSIYVKDASNNSFVVRVDDSSSIDLSSLGITVGSSITVTGPLSYYDFNYDNNYETYVYLKGNYQLMLTNGDDIVIE